jgi:hypothetical protein
MNLPNVSNGADQGNAGAVAFGGPQAAPANFTVGEIGFGPCWQAEPSLRELYDLACASIVRAECELEESNARIAVLEAEQRLLKNIIESLRDQLCADKCRDKAAADGGWANI